MDINALNPFSRSNTQSIEAAHDYRGIMPEVVRTGFEAAGSELAGFLIGRYSDTLQKTSVPIPLVAGAVLKGLGIWLNVATGGGSRLAPVVTGLGGAGMNAFFVLDGVARGHSSKDREFFLGAKTDRAKLAAAGGRPVDRLWGEHTAVGAIPQADEEGQWFDEGGLKHFANS